MHRLAHSSSSAAAGCLLCSLPAAGAGGGAARSFLAAATAAAVAVNVTAADRGGPCLLLWLSLHPIFLPLLLLLLLGPIP